MEPSVGFEPRLVSRLGQPELLDRRVQGAVEDELLDEDGRLEQGVLLAGRLGQVLVEVAQEAAYPARVGEVVDERPGVGSIRWKKRSRSLAASPLSQFGRSRIGLCSPNRSRVPGAPSSRRRSPAGNRGR